MAADFRYVSAPDVPPPPPGVFSNAVVADNVVYVSGMHAGGPDGIVGGASMLEQTREALRRAVSLVTAAGGSADRIVKLTIYVTDMGRRAEVSVARKEVFTTHLPASTFLQVSGFIQDGLLVEVDAIAHL
ncbi:2-iminobutanoate/2-iminopropanoate deaminase [Amorphus suaedae]